MPVEASMYSSVLTDYSLSSGLFGKKHYCSIDETFVPPQNVRPSRLLPLYAQGRAKG
jgi:hypothetical protein